MKLIQKYSRRELLLVLAIWLFLCGAAVATVAAIQTYGVQVVSYVETVKGGRAQRVAALLLSAQRRASEALELANDLNKGKEKPSFLPADNPRVLQALDLYRKAETMDLGDLYRIDWAPHYIALAHIHAALGDEPQQARYLIRSAIAQQDYELAKRYIEQVLSRMPNDPPTLLLSAELSNRKQDKVGLQVTVELLRRLPNPPVETEYYWSLYALLTDNKDEFEKAMVKYLAQVPSSLNGRKRLSDHLGANKRPAEAEKVLLDGLKYGAVEDASYMHRLGLLAMDLQKYPDAVNYLKTAVEGASFNGQLRWDLARAYTRAGQTARANVTMAEAIKLDSSLQTRALE